MEGQINSNLYGRLTLFAELSSPLGQANPGKNKREDLRREEK